jgi:hypothetical protein
MWGLRDACTLHGLRCGSYVTLTRDGWHVVGENRAGRTPNAAPHTPADAGSGQARPAGQPARRASAR